MLLQLCSKHMFFMCLISHFVSINSLQTLPNETSLAKSKSNSFNDNEQGRVTDHAEESQKEKEKEIYRFLNNDKHIETLHWAVKLNLHVHRSSSYIAEADNMLFLADKIASELKLINLGRIGHFKDWFLFGHVKHFETIQSLSNVYDKLHEVLPFHIVFQNSSNRAYDIDNRTSAITLIKEHFINELKQVNNIMVDDWISLVKDVNTGLDKHSSVDSHRQQVVKFRQKRSLEFSDPAFKDQWHLVNYMEPSMDINVTGVWEAGYTGKGVTVCVIDDGIEWDNPDLYPNFSERGSWDLNSNDGDPMPDLNKAKNHHGTRCAGEIAAAANDVCAVGVAYNSHISGLRVLDGPMTDQMEATAFTTAMDINDVYSCSWGPEDDGKTVDGPDHLASEGLHHGIDYGRNGYGSLFVVASGNGGLNKDNCNFDGYANSIFTITIGAVDERGSMPYYAEECASMLAVTFSSGNGFMTRNIVTTDWTHQGGTGCTSDHTGTSAAAPLASGIIALALDANPCLSWRDVQYLVILTAVKVDIDVAHWTKNAAGLHHSHKHGFGLMNAWRMVNAAKVWESVPWMSTFATHKMEVLRQIQLNNQPLELTYTVTDDDLSGFDLFMLEQVQLEIWLDHDRRGDLSMTVRCPSNTESVIAALRPADRSSEGFTGWTFTTVRCWGETPKGTYVFTIRDHGKALVPSGVLKIWRLILHGTPMTPEDFQLKKRAVNKSFSGSRLDKKFTAECSPPPEIFEYNPVISQRWLKFVALTSVFCLFMAIYETFEYIFCYDDEKKEEQKFQKLQQRAVAMSIEDTTSSSTRRNNDPIAAEYIPLEDLSNNDEITTAEILNQELLLATASYNAQNNQSSYRSYDESRDMATGSSLAGATSYPSVPAHVSHDQSYDIQMEDLDLGENSYLLQR